MFKLRRAWILYRRVKLKIHVIPTSIEVADQFTRRPFFTRTARKEWLVFHYTTYPTRRETDEKNYQDRDFYHAMKIHTINCKSISNVLTNNWNENIMNHFFFFIVPFFSIIEREKKNWNEFFEIMPVRRWCLLTNAAYYWNIYVVKLLEYSGNFNFDLKLATNETWIIER